MVFFFSLLSALVSAARLLSDLTCTSTSRSSLHRRASRIPEMPGPDLRALQSRRLSGTSSPTPAAVTQGEELHTDREKGGLGFSWASRSRNDLTEIQSQAPGGVDRTGQKMGPKWRPRSCSHRVVVPVGFVQAYCHGLGIHLWPSERARSSVPFIVITHFL